MEGIFAALLELRDGRQRGGRPDSSSATRTAVQVFR